MGDLTSVREYIIEETLQDVSSYELPSFSKKRRLPQNAFAIRDVNLDVQRGVLTAKVDSAVKYGKWNDRKSYSPRSINLYGDTQDTDVTDYDITLWWPEWENALDDIEHRQDIEDSEEPLSSHIASYLFNDVDSKVHCTCPGFHWNGVKKKIKKFEVPIDGGNHPMGNGMKLRSINVSKPLCKHLFAFVGKAKSILTYAIDNSDLQKRFKIG